MNTVFMEWVKLKKESFENDGVNTDDIKWIEKNIDMIRTKLNRLTPDGVNKWESDPNGWGQ